MKVRVGLRLDVCQLIIARFNLSKFDVTFTLICSLVFWKPFTEKLFTLTWLNSRVKIYFKYRDLQLYP